MKILHINCNFLNNKVHQKMIEHMSEKNVENSVFVPVYDENEKFSDSNILVKKSFNKYDRVLFYYKSKKIKEMVEKSYKIKDFDIIHAYTLFTDGNVAYNLKKKYNIPYVVAIRNTDVNTFFKYMIFLRKHGIKIMQDANAIFFLSNTYKKEVFDKYVPIQLKNELEQKTYIIPNGIDDFWFDKNFRQLKKISKEKINIIYVGKIDKNKNIISTQKALSILRQKGYNINFTIIGKIENKKIFNKIIDFPNTKYYENMPKEKLKKFYKENDIFVMPSKTETFGLVYAEAISQGLPVIYTSGQGFDEQFPNGWVGYSVYYKDFMQIANSIINIIDNYEIISKHCLDGSKKFSWNKICDKYEKIYIEITNKKEE